MGSSSGLVDWRGRPVNPKKHGGVRASIFIHALVLLSNAANIANIMNLVTYLRGTMHMGVAEASTTASNFFAALQMFSIPAAFLADSYIKRFYTVLIFGPIEILQVLVVAFKKRNVQLPDNASELKQLNQDDHNVLEELQRTDGFRCLEKSVVETGETGPWSLCTVTQVEETKIVLRMVPIFLSSVLGYIPVPLILNFTVQQGNTMDTKLGGVHISPATLFVIPTVFQMVILVLYDRFIVPFLRRITGYVGGVTHLQRIGIGFLSATVATGVAALVEAKRKRVAEENGLMEATTGIPMSVFWLTVQFFLLGVVDVTSFVGLLEFFYSEASTGMKSVGSSIFYCILGVSAWLGSLLIQVANRVTRRADGTGGWLDGTNLNMGKLDNFYWLLAVLELVSLFVYTFFARRYVYRNEQRVVDVDTKVPMEGATFGDVMI
ncbi:unnamed protein product [Triticum turgidum subsp. durum]|uniref:Uncharacterized protein n=1 Tax=Triticum turgidum subsp. durum TaxID=4567 RepID=A0A9R1NU65_TRITD|nr:unnamed protein product [Triticum turgidum subsp. durum]